MLPGPASSESGDSLDDLMERMPPESASEEEKAAFMEQVMATEAGAQLIRGFAEQITEGGSLDRMLKESEPEVPELQSPVRFIFRVELLETKIWRTLSLPADASFLNFHEAIQDAFGWLDTREHEFQVFEDGQLELTFSSCEEEGHFCEIQNPISQLIENGVDQFLYLYDFEAHWMHRVLFEKVVPAGAEGTSSDFRPAIHDGAGLCPPEDTKGVEDFQKFLQGDHPLAKEYGPELVTRIREGEFDPKAVRFR